MKSVVLAVIFALLPAVGFTQTSDGSANSVQSPTPDPASREDLEKATAEMKKVTIAAVREANKRAQTAIDVAEKKHQEELAKSRAEAKAQAQATVNTVVSANETTRLESAKQWRMVRIYGGGGLLLVAIISLVAFKKRNKPVEIRVIQTHTRNQEGILVDPDIQTLREYSARNENINPVPFILTLPKESVKVQCEAQLTENSEPLIVKVDGKKSFLRWKNRAGAVAKFLSDNNLLEKLRKIEVAS